MYYFCDDWHNSHMNVSGGVRTHLVVGEINRLWPLCRSRHWRSRLRHGVSTYGTIKKSCICSLCPFGKQYCLHVLGLSRYED